MSELQTVPLGKCYYANFAPFNHIYVRIIKTFAAQAKHSPYEACIFGATTLALTQSTLALSVMGHNQGQYKSAPEH